MAYREKLDEKFRRIMKAGAIQRSNRTYINQIVPVIKKDNSVRLYLGARKLNELMEDDWESPEQAEVLFQKFKGTKVISNLDMTNSFLQVPLHS